MVCGRWSGSSPSWDFADSWSIQTYGSHLASWNVPLFRIERGSKLLSIERGERQIENFAGRGDLQRHPCAEAAK